MNSTHPLWRWTKRRVGPLQVGDLLSLMARAILAVVLIMAAWAKLGDQTAAARAVQAFQLRNIVPFLTFEMEGALGVIVPIVEMFLAALLLVGLFTRWAGLASALLMGFFILAIISVWVRGISIDCGCFGGGGAVAPGETQYGKDILRDLGIALCGVWLFVWKRVRFGLDAWLNTQGEQ